VRRRGLGRGGHYGRDSDDGRSEKAESPSTRTAYDSSSIGHIGVFRRLRFVHLRCRHRGHVDELRRNSTRRRVHEDFAKFRRLHRRLHNFRRLANLLLDN